MQAMTLKPRVWRVSAEWVDGTPWMAECRLCGWHSSHRESLAAVNNALNHVRSWQHRYKADTWRLSSWLARGCLFSGQEASR